MRVTDLRATHSVYTDNLAEWQYLRASYTGSKALIDYGVLAKHERESSENYRTRKENAFGFSYSRAIVNLFTYYLFSKPIERFLGPLGEDDQWQMFEQDCDLEGTNFNQLFRTKMAQVISTGQCGFLVDKSSLVYASQSAEIEAQVYPYIASFSAENILDWTYERDENQRPFLAYLKLKNDDDQYLLWWTDHWEVWVEPETESESKDANPSSEAKLLRTGLNLLNEIPFVWLYNVKSDDKGLGISDITDIARIDVSIIRNVSQGEEVIDYSAFPMLITPKEPIGDDSADAVGVTAVLTFDPDTPEAKPSWLEAKCAEPITAILEWIANKVNEIYRSANTGGINATETASQSKSGIALTLEFRMLNALLVNKANQLRECQERLIHFWLKWQNRLDLAPDISIVAPESFDVANLASDLENALIAKTIVTSEAFSKAIQKRIATQMLPNMTDQEQEDINNDIDVSEVPVYAPPED